MREQPREIPQAPCVAQSRGAAVERIDAALESYRLGRAIDARTRDLRSSVRPLKGTPGSLAPYYQINITVEHLKERH